MSIKGHRDQIERDFLERDLWRRPLERDLWTDTLPGSDTRLLDFFREV